MFKVTEWVADRGQNHIIDEQVFDTYENALAYAKDSQWEVDIEDELGYLVYSM